jgi:hypothetical protein
MTVQVEGTMTVQVEGTMTVQVEGIMSTCWKDYEWLLISQEIIYASTN